MKFSAHCINIDNRTDRWQQFTSQGLPLRVSRFSAIEHEHANTGCTLSHIEVMRKCKPDEYMLIFEDDAYLLTDFDIFYKTLEQLPEKFDIMYLGATLWTAEELKLKEQWTVKRHSENLLKIMGAWSLHAYFIGYDFCQRIINTSIQHIHARRNLDTYNARVIQPEGNCYMIDPLMFIQKRTALDIERGEKDYGMEQRFEKMKRKLTQ